MTRDLGVRRMGQMDFAVFRPPHHAHRGLGEDKLASGERPLNGIENDAG
jgi:hypothetical protein